MFFSTFNRKKTAGFAAALTLAATVNFLALLIYLNVKKDATFLNLKFIL